MWATSIDELVRIFREGLLALVPVAERAHMPWREPKNYDDWDLMAAAIYRSIIISSFEHAEYEQRTLPLLDYDFRAKSYNANSFLADSESLRRAFVCFETLRVPFDTALFASVNDSGDVLGFERLDTSAVRFVLAARTDRGVACISSIKVRL